MTRSRIQTLISIDKMATVLEECDKAERRCALPFIWKKELKAKHIHISVCSLYCGKCLSHKNGIYVSTVCFPDEEEIKNIAEIA
jgi:hypothetical protein